MKNHLKITVALGLLLLVLPLFGYVAITGAAGSNTVQTHVGSKDVLNNTCRYCHNKVVDAAAGTSGNVTNAHKRHVMSVFLNYASNYVSGAPADDDSAGCSKCHQETVYRDDESVVSMIFEPAVGIQSISWGDFGTYEGDNSFMVDSNNTTETTASPGPNPARKDVDPQLCRKCHGGLYLGASSSHNDASYFTTETVSGGSVTIAIPNDPRGCTDDCHDGVTGVDADTAHGAGPGGGTWWVDQRYANSGVYCYRCHGELRWYETTETN